MFHFSPVYWYVLLCVLFFGHMAETHSPIVIRRDGSIWRKPSLFPAFILSLVLILVAGFRYYVGTDFGTYFQRDVPSWSQVFYNVVHFKEGGFSFLTKIANLWGHNGQNLIFLCSFITVGVYCRAIYKFSFMYLSAILLYLFMGEWQGSFNAVRQYVAAAILFAGHRFILQRRLRKYVVVVLFAALFHKTAIIMLIPYYILTKKPNHAQLVRLAIAAIAIRFSYGFLFDAVEELKGADLATEEDPYLYNSVNPLRILVAFIPVGIYTLMCPKVFFTREQVFYINACLFHSFTMLAAAGSCYLARVGSYTSAMTIIGFGTLFQMIEKKRNRQATMLIVLALYLFYWLYSLHIVSGGRFQFNFDVGF